MPWADVPVIGTLSQALGVMQLGHLIKLGGAAAGATIFFMSLLWVIFTIGCMVFVGFSFIRNDFRVLWPLRLVMLHGNQPDSVQIHMFTLQGLEDNSQADYRGFIRSTVQYAHASVFLSNWRHT